MNYIDLSIEPAIAYIIARMIKMDHYSNILIYEFHEKVGVTSHFNCLQGLEQFRERCSEFYSAFLQPSIVDDYPANIHLLMKLSNEWFMIKDCGANFYLGYGPSGIIELRRNCKFKGVKIVYQEGSIDDFITGHFISAEEKKDEYEMIIKSFVLYGVGLERLKKSFPDLKEETIRDMMLPSLNTVFEGRVHGESKNAKGKTNILLREVDGLTQYIFELKVWKSIKKFEEGYNQLLGYLSDSDTKAGMIIFSYNKSLLGVIEKVKTFYKLKKANFLTLDETRQNEIRIEVNHPCDYKKKLVLHVFFINLH